MLRARQVLDDAKRASSSLNAIEDEQLRRVFWTASVVLARAALHVLDKVDAASDPTLREEADRRWKELNDSRPEPEIFWNFLELERNLVLKQFEFAPDLEDRFLMRAGGDGFIFATDGSKLALAGFFSIRTDGPFKGKDGLTVLREALNWVDGYISRIEKSTSDCNECATVKAAMGRPSSVREDIAKMRGGGDEKITTDEVMKLTRGR